MKTDQSQMSSRTRPAISRWSSITLGAFYAMKTSGLKLTSGSILTTILLLLSTVTYGQANKTMGVTASGQPEIYLVPDVVGQFNQLALRPDALAFGLGNAPKPTLRKHYQGIVRKHGPGTPYMFLSRSGKDVECPLDCDDDPGNIYIVRMESRDTNGERMRSNRLVRGWPIDVPLPEVGYPVPGVNWSTPPDPRDKTVSKITFNGLNGWPNYGHPGGMQLVGDVLVVPLSDPYAGDSANRILFIDVSNPETPALTSQFDPLEVSAPSEKFGAGLLAVTPVRNPNGPGVRYIMLIAGKNNEDVRLYRSLPTSAEEGWTDLKSTNLKWEFIRSWTGGELDDSGKDTWPDDKAHQMFNFVRQESLTEVSLTGRLFMIGARNDTSVYLPGSGNDYLDLYEVHVDQYGNPADDLVTHIERKNVGTTSIGGGGDTSHFTGSTGVYVSPSGELIVYASEHENQGPFELLPGGEGGRPTVRFGEYRHREMVRPGSPTLKPSVEATGPFAVDEGSTVMLSARGKAPITKAWLQLFEDDGMGLSLPDGLLNDDRWLAVDYKDWPKDDYDNFPKLWSPFNDNAGSWRWFAPTGCTLRVNQHSIDDSDFPGRRKTLAGTGLVEEATDLDAVTDDGAGGSMNDMISSVQFSCDAYYSAPIGVAWDFDLNGTFETSGNTPTFSAAELDGPVEPALHSIPVQAKHQTDTTPLGQSAPATVGVRVRNVAPSVAGLDLVDALGFKIGSDVPFALVNLEYTVKASFTDPGKPDRQTARLNFGDGTPLQSGAFDKFSDAFGGATGRLEQRHRYGATGTYTIRLEVEDDDRGVTAATRSITVVSPAQIIELVVKEIDLLLATATNQAVIRALRDARDTLAGNNNGAARNGTLDALASGNLVAALVKIKAAIEALERAEVAGAADLHKLKNLLGFTAESVAQGAYQDAVAAVGMPNPGQATQLERIRQSIADGHARLVNGEYVAAVDLFIDAVARARLSP